MLQLPGDKSVSHRSLLLNGMAKGTARVRRLLRSEDVASSANAVRAFGVRVEDRGDEILVHGTGELREPHDVVDCGNSGTSMRLLAGIAARHPFATVLTGDASLRGRPMARVGNPLRRMGATVDGRDGGDRAPLFIRGGGLSTCVHDLAIASGQVKSAILLASLDCGVTLREPKKSRDHTELMLRLMGADLTEDQGWLRLAGGAKLDAIDVDVPGDLSSAAFFLVAGAIVEGSDITLPGVGANPTRTGVIDALTQMGADLTVTPVATAGAEPAADLRIRAGGLRGIRVDGELALRCLDELPVLAVAAAFAEGETVIADAAELRVKESDRIARVVTGLRAIGAEVDENPDGMVIQGGRPHGPARIDATHDHRIAMAFAVAGMAGRGELTLDGAEAINSSYPNFLDHVEALRG